MLSLKRVGAGLALVGLGATAYHLFKKPTTQKIVQQVGETIKTQVVIGGLMLSRITTAVADNLPTKVIETKPEIEVAKPKMRWLISQKDDLIYLLGSVAASYALMGVYFKLKVEPAIVWTAWVLLFDGPHVWGTFTRTYFDKEEFASRRNLLLGTLGFVIASPIAAQLHSKSFFAFAYLWAYYHLIKQHYGFMILYKKKNSDLAKLDNWLDKALMFTGLTLPLIRAITNPNSPYQRILYGKYLPSFVPKLAFGAFASTLAAYLGRQVWKFTHNQPLNVPKQLLFLATIPMHNVVGALPFNQLAFNPNRWQVTPLAAPISILTIYHNIQYNRLIWFHNQNKYGKGLAAGKHYGLATHFSKNLVRFGLAGVGFTVLYRAADFLNLRKSVAKKPWLSGLVWGVAFAHYYLDSKIWRVRQDQTLNKSLKMS